QLRRSARRVSTEMRMTEVEDWGSPLNPAEPGQSSQVIPIRHATTRPYVLNGISSPRASSSWTAFRKLDTDEVTPSRAIGPPIFFAIGTAPSLTSRAQSRFLPERPGI